IREQVVDKVSGLGLGALCQHPGTHFTMGRLMVTTIEQGSPQLFTTRSNLLHKMNLEKGEGQSGDKVTGLGLGVLWQHPGTHFTMGRLMVTTIEQGSPQLFTARSNLLHTMNLEKGEGQSGDKVTGLGLGALWQHPGTHFTMGRLMVTTIEQGSPQLFTTRSNLLREMNSGTSGGQSVWVRVGSTLPTSWNTFHNGQTDGDHHRTRLSSIIHRPE